MRTSPSSRRAGIVALALACLVSAAALQAQQQQQNQGTLSKLAEQKRQTSDTSATPVVLTIEGGGSLGVHEAGMTWAFVEIFKHLREGGSPGNLPRLRLAAVSGASAGSINALLAATAWCDKRVGRPPEESMMWRAWVPTGVQQL
ncbi:MAG TPA: patatin-like phospholipase family protein, partial [Gemmatimonadaceae bacterium]|nr:patatin-like phospholipase family protein [Gemmatimonadaceae bacterium]